MNQVAGDFQSVARAACERLAQNKPVRRNLPGDGRLRIDRQLPFLCAYRRPVAEDSDNPHAADPGTVELVTTEAAYVFASAAPENHEGLSQLCDEVCHTLKEHFGAFLFLELWADEEGDVQNEDAPAFWIHTPEPETLPTALSEFEDALRQIRVHGWRAEVRIHHAERPAPAELPPLLPTDGRNGGGSFALGLAVRPIYRDPRSGEVYPIALQALRRQLSPALRELAATFAGAKDAPNAISAEALGPSSLVKAAAEVDRRLDEVADSFDFLLQVTPVNSTRAWREFFDGGFEREPTLYYRPMPYDPNLLKRRLFDIPIERIEDPTLGFIFRQKQEELDRQLSALRDLETPAFLYESLQLYGPVEEPLAALAGQILEAVPARPAQPGRGRRSFCAKEVAAAARREIAFYRRRLPDFQARVVVSDEIAGGLMVSRDRLLVSQTQRIPRRRLNALLQHEVGTHLLTWINGSNQPFRQLATGLAGYEALQEGMAALAEYLVGGLTRARLRTLAARVVAVGALVEGASFVETYRLLRGHGLPERKAFLSTLRVYRGGGLTKDAIYLRGLRSLLDYLAAGHDLEPLYVGKIALEHVPFVQEFRRRGIVQPPPLLPRFWNDDDARRRLEHARSRSVLDLLENRR